MSIPTDIKQRTSSGKSSSSSDINKKPADFDTKSVLADDNLVDVEPKPFRFINLIFRQGNSSQDLDATATRRSVYDDPVLAPHYLPKPDYENIHRFDIKARWTYREERVCRALICLSVH
jgi:hypothetical protein